MKSRPKISEDEFLKIPIINTYTDSQNIIEDLHQCMKQKCTKQFMHTRNNDD